MEQFRAWIALAKPTTLTPGQGWRRNLGLLAEAWRPASRQASGMTPRLRALAVSLLAVLLLGSMAGSALAITPQQVAQEVGVEEREEQAEEAAEQAEEATLAPSLALAPAAHARVIAGLDHQIRFIQRLVRHIRQSKRIDRLLPHTTTRWLEHLPKKNQHIKELELKIRELRQREAEAAAG
jgi:hypothetical protein